MDVEVRVLRQVDLDDRIDLLEVDASRDHVGREEKSRLFLSKLLEDAHSLLLFDLAVDLAHVVAFEDLVPVSDVSQEELEVEVDGVTGVEEYDDLVVSVFDDVLRQEDQLVESLLHEQVVVVQSDGHFVLVSPLVVRFLFRDRLLSVAR